MTAPIASGWSGCRVGLAPTGKRRLCTAHAKGGSQGLSFEQESERHECATDMKNEQQPVGSAYV
jgi:hypothetical protein